VEDLITVNLEKRNVAYEMKNCYTSFPVNKKKNIIGSLPAGMQAKTRKTKTIYK